MRFIQKLRWRSFLENMACFFWGSACLYWSVLGDFNQLLIPFFQPFVFAAGLILICIPIFLSQSSVEIPCEIPVPFPLLILSLLSVIVTFRCNPDGFELKTIINRSFAQPALQNKPNPLYENKASQEVIDADLLDIYYSAMDPQIRAACQGKKVRLLGQGLFHEDRPHLIRLLMWCCAADARPLNIEIRGESKNFVQEDWYEAIGFIDFEIRGERTIPILHLESLHRAYPPEDIYLY